jgi:hypothetical protein
MAIKINVGLAKKIGQPDFGSLGANCNVEFEYGGPCDAGSSEAFQKAVAKAFQACRKAVESELAKSASTTAAVDRNGQTRVTGNQRSGQQKKAVAAGSNRLATSSQIRAIHAISRRAGTDLVACLSQRFETDDVASLTVREASNLIDWLKQSLEPAPS